MNAYRNYNNNTSALSKNLEKLSSGYKINRAGDDAAGLAISEKMRAQITGLNAAQKNVKDGVSLVKTAEGAMQEIQDMLNRMDYLATQSANGTYDNDVDRMNLQKEVNALRSEIDRIADSANFNGIKLLDGTQAGKVGAAADVTVQVSTVTSTLGAKESGGPVTDLSANFAPVADPVTNGHYGLHEGTESTAAGEVSFSIDLKDLKITGVTDDAAGSSFTVTIGGTGVQVAISSATGEVTGQDIAEKLQSVTVNIGGVDFVGDATATDGKLTFTAATANVDGHAASINEALTGETAKVEIGTSDSDVAMGDNWVHGLQDVTKAVDTKAGTMGSAGGFPPSC